MQSGFGSVTKGRVCNGADGMPDDPPKLGGAAAVPKGAAAVSSPLPLAGAPPAFPDRDIGELLGGPHVKLMPPVLPQFHCIRANSSPDMYVPLEITLSLTRMCAWGASGFIPNIQTGVVHGWATRRGAAVQKKSSDEHRPLHLLTWLLTPTSNREQSCTCRR